MKRRLLMLASPALLVACASPEVQDYAAEKPALDLRQYFNGPMTGYGIFTGRNMAWAKLRFTASAARWVASERWHARQKQRWEEDGSYLLEVPYSQPQELVMDVLRYGADVEVLEPASLREQVRTALTQAAARYA